MNAGQRERILLIDDDEHLLVTLGDFLSYAGYSVTTASSGEEGVAAIEAALPDLIILDVGMPGMGGLGFLRATAGPGGKPRCPVLVFTARAAMKEFFETFEADGFLAKPCDSSVLLEKIRGILGRNPPALREGEKRVLLGEDDRDVRSALAEALARHSYSVDHVASGPELVERAVATQPHLIVIKQVFPRMNGDLVASILREMPNTRTIPMIIYDSSGLWTAHKNRCLSASPEVKRFVSSDRPDDIVRAVAGVLE